jgi:hypothetical protein
LFMSEESMSRGEAAATDGITVYGIDFTSRPTRRKPITCLESRLVGNQLTAVAVLEWSTWSEFEGFLTTRTSPAGWIAGIDSPFGLSKQFIENMDWPNDWADYIDHEVEPLDRSGWRKKLDDYKRHRRPGDKEHRRCTDKIAGSLSPQKQYGVPVGMMFFEAVRRLRESGVTIPRLQDGDSERIVVEAYPGVAVRQIAGKKLSYKSDIKKKQTKAHRSNRKTIMDKLSKDSASKVYGIRVNNHHLLVDPHSDVTGDRLDALLCCVQAAWAWHHGPPDYGLPSITIVDREGWIADPIWTRQPMECHTG